MDTRLILTVTTAQGQPTLNLPGSLAMDEIRKIVRNRFGMQTSDNNWALPHSFCGALVPAPAQRVEEHPATVSLLTQRHHLRAV